MESNALAADASPKLLQYRAKRLIQAERQHERALAAVVAMQKLYPENRVEPSEVIATTAEPVTPRAILQQLRTEIADGEADLFESFPYERQPDRIRVGTNA